ncbi:MAG: class I SAM-dependent methyltransferase [Halobacteriaceae archaeon]
MHPRQAFEEWAAEGRDRGMEDRHWATAKRALARMPVEDGDRVLDLGTGSGYALRALRERGATGVGLDAAPGMAANARAYAAEADARPDLSFVVGEFESLPFADGVFDHVWSMEAFYYASDPAAVLREVRRVLRPGGTFYCAVNYYAENPYSESWPANLGVEMVRWSRAQYREAFRETGFVVAEQDAVPDRDRDIPPADAFPTEGFESREAMVERFRTLGTLLTVGVRP